MTCRVNYCDKPVRSRGLCRGHYMKLLRYGRTDGGQRTQHGLSGSPAHKSWSRMINRCTRPSAPQYEKYHSLGFDPSWRFFENFYRDMGDRPEGMTLDRIDNTMGYSKWNCRWAGWRTQNNNKSIKSNQYIKRRLELGHAK